MQQIFIIYCRVLWVPNSDIQAYERKLLKRFANAKTLPNTRQHHCFIPSGEYMIMKTTSFSTNQTQIKLNLNEN